VTSSAETLAPLIEPLLALNIRLDRRTGGWTWTYYCADCGSKPSDGPDWRTHQNTHDQKWFFSGNGFLTRPLPSPLWGGDTPSHYTHRHILYSCAFGARLGPSKPKSWIRFWA